MNAAALWRQPNGRTSIHRGLGPVGHPTINRRSSVSRSRHSFAALEQGKVLVDFDARSGHNHGTKFRMRQDCLPMLYEKATVIVPREPGQMRRVA